MMISRDALNVDQPKLNLWRIKRAKIIVLAKAFVDIACVDQLAPYVVLEIKQKHEQTASANAVATSSKDKPLTNKQYKRWIVWMKLGRAIFRCHQLSDRSFHYHNKQFPVCARCTGIFFGFVLLGPIITLFIAPNMIISLFLFSLMVLDGTIQIVWQQPSNNLKRLITGLASGYANYTFIYYIISMIILLSN